MSLAACCIALIAPAAALAAPLTQAPVQPATEQKASPRGGEMAQGEPKSPSTPVTPPAPPTAQVAPTSASPAASTTVTAKGEDEKDDKTGFHIGIDLGNSVTTPTFLYADRVDSDYVGSDLEMSASYAFFVKDIKLSASAMGSISYEYTLPDNESARRFSWTDLRFSLGAPGLYKNAATGISFSPSLSLTAPITMESWSATTITNLGVSIKAGRSFGPVGVSLAINGSKGFHVSQVKAARNSDARDAQGRLLQVRRPDDPFAEVMGTNTSGSIGGSIRLSYQATEALTFSMSYSLAKSFKYTIGIDQFSPKGMRSDGSPIAVGTGTSDRSTFNISAGYDLTDRFGISLGLATAQNPVDATGVRFPFFALGNAALGVTSVNLGLSAAF